jgi:hypothetical protein
MRNPLLIMIITKAKLSLKSFVLSESLLEPCYGCSGSCKGIMHKNIVGIVDFARIP